MDSLGATARTPRRRMPNFSQAADSPMLSQTPRRPRSGSLSATVPIASPKPHVDLLKTPRHSYHKPTGSVAVAIPAGKATNELPVTWDVTIEPSTATGKVQTVVSPYEHATKVTLYGALNTIILIPVMISFAQIIFRDPFFQPYMADLIKLVLVSAAVHQLCFTVASSLPFAVGQVQDAGLIFLSAMATSTVRQLDPQANDSQQTLDQILATTLFTLAGSTALLGIALIITGKLKLASFVQYLPMPVVGGYLAYIGFYCLEAGLSMMANTTIKEPADWLKLANSDALVHITPGVLAGIALFMVLSRCDHMAVLPGGMFAILVVFYSIVLLGGYSLEDARKAGWVSPLPQAPRSIFEIYQYYAPTEMIYSGVSSQIVTWVSMYFVVAFSSSLDVAAVEMALGTPLDHNHELRTVGISNLVSGLTGGFTGSYIFSQTIFTLRGKLDSRWNGVLIFVLEIFLVLCPFSVIAYVPKVFFGALQTLIGVDLMMEWMWHARHKMLRREYAIVWLTFLVMNLANLEVGIVVGIVVAGFNFIASYIRVSSVRRVMKRSHVERDLRERALLQTMQLAIVTLELDGYIFFGSSVKMMDEIRRHVLVEGHTTTTATASGASAASNERQPLLGAKPALGNGHANYATSTASSNSLSSPSFDADFNGLTTLGEELAEASGRNTRAPTTGGSTAASALHTALLNNLVSDDDRRVNVRAQRTRFFILDFERVRGVDATAVRSCFNATKQLLAQHGIVLVFACLSHTIERLLRVHDVIEPEDGSGLCSLVFESVDKALEWCEDEILVEEGVLPLSESMPTGSGMALLNELLPKNPTMSPQPQPEPTMAVGDSLATVLTDDIGKLYITQLVKHSGDRVYHAGSPVAGIYFVGCGKVDVYLPSNLHERMGPGFAGKKRIARICQGGIFGASEMILNMRYQFTAEAKATTTLFFLSKSKYQMMQQKHPRIAARFHQAILQSMARGVMESFLTDD